MPWRKAIGSKQKLQNSSISKEQPWWKKSRNGILPGPPPHKSQDKNRQKDDDNCRHPPVLFEI
jgi:hypothetical protein